MVEKIAVDDDGLRRIVEVVLDFFELGNLGAFSDVERTVEESETVRPVQAGGDDFGLAFPVPVDDRIDLVELAVADEHGALITEPQRARICDPTGIDLDLEALGQLELRNRQFVLRRRERRRWDATQLARHFSVGNVGTPRHGGGLRLHARYRCPRRGRGRLGCRWGCGRLCRRLLCWLRWGRGRLRRWLLCWLLREGRQRYKKGTEHSSEQKALQGR